jgi:uncharacterized protein
MDKSEVKNSPIINYFLWVFSLSIPFWILGFVITDTSKIIPINLPISALMAVCPLLAASILVYQKRKSQGVKALLKQTFDYQKIRDKKWYFPIIFLMPIIALLSYWYLNFTEILLPKPQLSFSSIFIFFFVYFIGAIGEEIGWSGYIIEPMQNKYGVLKASIIIGIIWAIWHIIPYYQAHQSTNWIVWQCMGTVFLRIIMVWIFNNVGKSVFSMVLFHTMLNISPNLIPNYGSHYDPFVFCMLLMIAVLFIIFFWNAKTLAKFKSHVQ